MNKSIERGKVIKQNVNGTIFDVRQVPKYIIDKESKRKRMETSTFCLFLGKNKIKSGFKTADAAGDFAVENSTKYDKKDRKFR